MLEKIIDELLFLKSLKVFFTLFFYDQEVRIFCLKNVLLNQFMNTITAVFVSTNF